MEVEDEIQAIPHAESQVHNTSTNTDEPRMPQPEYPSDSPERTQDSSTCIIPEIEALQISPERTQDSSICTGPEIVLPTSLEGTHNNSNRAADSRSLTPQKDDLSGNDIAGGAAEDGILKLRKYQLELTRAPLQGTNSIISAPGGCGKTVIAGHVIRQLFLQKKNPERPFKAFYIINTKELMEQKSATLNRVVLKVRVIDKGQDIYRILESSMVVVLTAMRVMNAIKQGIFKLIDVDLLVFDECHHTHGNHPYNEIMHMYLGAKLDNHTPGLPQILGLTAATGILKFKSARDHFLTLCGNLDCHQISQVRDNQEEFKIFHPKSNEVEIIAVPGRAENDPYRGQLMDFMKEIQRNIGEKCEISPGTHAYEIWAFSRRKTAEKKRELDKMMTFTALITLNAALIFHEELRGIDSLKILQDFFLVPPILFFRDCGKNLRLTRKERIGLCHLFFEKDYTPEEKWYQYFTMLEPQLKLLVDGTDDSKLLISLKSLLQKHNQERNDGQGLLLARTRFLTEKLVQYIKDRPELTEIVRPARLTGQEGDQYSMKEEERIKVLQQFRNGTINLLVATDVVEGLDLPQCDYVIRYNLTTNDIGGLESRVKARHCYLIVPEGCDVEKRELENRKKMREIEETLNYFKNEDPTKFAALIETKQREGWESYKSKKKRQGASSKSTTRIDPSQVRIFCIQCYSLLTFGKHIKKKGTFYICVDKELLGQVIVKKWDASDARWKAFSTAYHTGEILCGNETCSRKLGQIVQFRQGRRAEGYILGRQHIMFDLSYEQFQECRGWSTVPFPVEEEALDGPAESPRLLEFDF